MPVTEVMDTATGGASLIASATCSAFMLGSLGCNRRHDAALADFGDKVSQRNVTPAGNAGIEVALAEVDVERADLFTQRLAVRYPRTPRLPG